MQSRGGLTDPRSGEFRCRRTPCCRRWLPIDAGLGDSCAVRRLNTPGQRYVRRPPGGKGQFGRPWQPGGPVVARIRIHHVPSGPVVTARARDSWHGRCRVSVWQETRTGLSFHHEPRRAVETCLDCLGLALHGAPSVEIRVYLPLPGPVTSRRTHPAGHPRGRPKSTLVPAFCLA